MAVLGIDLDRWPLGTAYARIEVSQRLGKTREVVAREAIVMHARPHSDRFPQHARVRPVSNAQVAARRSRRLGPGLDGVECRVDPAGQEVEVGVGWVVRVERLKAETLPPLAGAIMEGGHDDGTAGRLGVDLGRGGKYLRDERGADAETSVRRIDGKTAQQQRGDGIRSVLGNRSGCCAAVNRGHGEARVRDHGVLACGDDPGSRRVAATVLTGVAAQPVVERRLAGVEAAAIVSRGIERLGTPEVSQSSGSRAGGPARPPAAR